MLKYVAAPDSRRVYDKSGRTFTPVRYTLVEDPCVDHGLRAFAG
jgi:hypothetical protein